MRASCPLRHGRPFHPRRVRLPVCGAGAALAALMAVSLLAIAAPLRAPPTPEEQAELGFIERLYREGDAYRAESEALRFEHQRPLHPQRPAVELARAKLYYRAGRYDEATLALYSLLDRTPRADAARDARRLLAFSHLRRGDAARAAETADALAGADGATPDAAELAALTAPPADAVDPDRAVAWSTWLPGSGYFLLEQPAKAATGLTLNLALLGAAVLSVQNENAPAALLFLVLEAMLWQGGRSGVRQDAQALNRRLEARRLDAWLERRGERELLGVGLALHFGGG